MFDDLSNLGVHQIDFNAMCYIANFVKELEENDADNDKNNDYCKVINAYVCI